MRRAVLAALAVCLAAGCLESGEFAASAPGVDGVAVELRDFAGEAVPRDAAPRRPVIAISAGSPVLPLADSVLLLSGLPDAALIDDLGRSPLRAEHRARALALLFQTAPEGALLSPEAPLEPGAEHTLAIAAWARAQPDRALTEPGSPLLWPFRTASDAAAGARVTGAYPADGSAGIGTNLSHAVIALDGELADAADAVWIEGPDGLATDTAIESGACELLAPEHAAAFCVVLHPRARLLPSASYALVVGRGASDAQGAPVGPWRSRFDTAPGADTTRPRVLPRTCALDEAAIDAGCALVDDRSVALRVRVDEPVVAALLEPDGQPRIALVAPRGEVELTLRGLAPGSRLPGRLRLRDASGNHVEYPLALSTLPPLPSVSIVELRADPLGAEPAQEFVELLNYGQRPVELRGMSLDDRPDARSPPIERELRLLPGARALLVADAFDADDARDAAPPPGTALLRVGSSLATSGLSNAGEAIFLRDASGQRLSAAPATPRPRAGVCTVRVSDDMRDGSPGSFAHDPDGGCSPGR